MKWAVLLLPLMFASPAWSMDKAELEHMVRQDCGSCHGMTLKGGLGNPLNPQDLAGKDDEALVATILDGRPGTPMPPWRGLLFEDDARWIVNYLKGGRHD